MFAEAIDHIAFAWGRELLFTSINMDTFVATSREQDVPEDVTEFLSYLFTEVLDGRNARIADGVQRALGRSARKFSEFARETNEEICLQSFDRRGRGAA